MLPNEPKNEETTNMPNSAKSTLSVNKQNAKLPNHEIPSRTNKTDKATLPDVVDENQSANSENETLPNESDSFDPFNNNQNPHNDKAMLPNEDPSSNNPECASLPDVAEADSDQSEDPNQMEQEYLMDSDPEIQIKNPFAPRRRPEQLGPIRHSFNLTTDSIPDYFLPELKMMRIDDRGTWIPPPKRVVAKRTGNGKVYSYFRKRVPIQQEQQLGPCSVCRDRRKS